MTQCPCGSGQDLKDCCRPLIDGTPAPTAEALMRSRYSGFVLGEIGYLADTLSLDLRADFDQVEAETTTREAKWQGLDIRAVLGGGEQDDSGSVEFVARFKVQGQTRVHHELAKFEREQGRWMCVGGQVNPKAPPRQVANVGRNDPCPCGSGRKFKKCCGG